jgi:hypothetical protein
MTDIHVRHVVTRQHVAIIDVLDDQHRAHRITHLFGDGWKCGCPAGRQCPHIERARQLVPGVEEGTP